MGPLTTPRAKQQPQSPLDKQHKQPEAGMSAQMSPVESFFEGRSVLVTGASGFIGRVLLEKLLRVYPGIQRIYILVRAKRGQPAAARLHKHLLNAAIFDRLRAMPDSERLLAKIVLVEGDIAQPQLGLSERDMAKLVGDETLSIVFHSAATIKFDEPLKVSVTLNLAATRAIVRLCSQLKHLAALCHVSTAYVNSDIIDGRPIGERLYPIGEQPGAMIQLAELMDESVMQLIKGRVVGARPNTYTYTKALAEHLIAAEAAHLPVAIVRPSIVAAGWREPMPGWIDNLNGPTGLILAIGKGLLRSMHVTRDVVADVVPVDVVVNCMIAAAHHVALEHQARRAQVCSLPMAQANPEELDGTEKTKEANCSGKLEANQPKPESKPEHKPVAELAEETQPDGPFVVHCNSGDINPITWGQMEDTFFPVIRRFPSAQVFRYPFGSFKSNKYHDLATRMVVHYLPALLVDLLCLLLGKKRQLLSIYNKLHSATGALSHFGTHNYRFASSNMRRLQAELEPRDRLQLYMDIERLDWDNFWADYVLGARRYVLKEPDETLAEARKSFKRSYYLEMVLRGLLLLLLCYLAAGSVPVRWALQAVGLAW